MILSRSWCCDTYDWPSAAMLTACSWLLRTSSMQAVNRSSSSMEFGSTRKTALAGISASGSMHDPGQDRKERHDSEMFADRRSEHHLLGPCLDGEKGGSVKATMSSAMSLIQPPSDATQPRSDNACLACSASRDCRPSEADRWQ